MSSSSHNFELDTSYGYTVKKPAACMKNIINILKPYEKIKIPSWEICRKTCVTNEKCEYFKFEKAECFLMNIYYKSKRQVVSGEKFCGRERIPKYALAPTSK